MPLTGTTSLYTEVKGEEAPHGRLLIDVSAIATGDNQVHLSQLFIKLRAARFSPASEAKGGICRMVLPGNTEEEKGQGTFEADGKSASYHRLTSLLPGLPFQFGPWKLASADPGAHCLPFQV